jgi:1-deoxy-D-xylulose-5-phosphate reductoisomerase
VGGVRLAGAALRPLVVLGATGSIGRQAIDVGEHLGVSVVAIAAGTVSDGLLALAARLPEALVAVAESGDQMDDARSLLGNRISVGDDAVAALAQTPGAIVVNGIVGAAGLRPSLAALEAGNRLALANKESMVTAGPLVNGSLQRGGGELIPVDSEHSAIWQCLNGEDLTEVRRIVLTASGGPFRTAPADLSAVTVEQALQHPTWQMGPRITIDSATLMNKAFEVIEAHNLFGVALEQIDVVVHPQSWVHSLVEFVDGVVKAELGPPDMRKPIQYALTHPHREPADHAAMALPGMVLEFAEPDRERFPSLDLGYQAAKAGGTAPAVLNAADEVAVAAFLDRRIAFSDIAVVAEQTLEAVATAPLQDLGDVADADLQARSAAERVVRARAG